MIAGLKVCALSTCPDPIVCCVAAWALNAVSAMLADSVDLKSHNRSTFAVESRLPPKVWRLARFIVAEEPYAEFMSHLQE